MLHSPRKNIINCIFTSAVHVCFDSSSIYVIVLFSSQLGLWGSPVLVRFCIYILFLCNYNNDNNSIQRRNSRFFTIPSLRHEPSPTSTLKWPGHNHVQITCNTSSAYLMQYVMSHAKWCEGTAQLLNLTELKSHLFELYFIGWTINQWRRGGNWSTRRSKTRTGTIALVAG